MEKHRLAKKRNYFKFVLAGLPKPVDFEVLTEKEKLAWEQIKSIRNSLLVEFNKNSESMGLKIHTYCWCGKKMRKTSCGDEFCNYSNKTITDEKA